MGQKFLGVRNFGVKFLCGAKTERVSALWESEDTFGVCNIYVLFYFLAAMRSSRSDNVTRFVCSFVRLSVRP